MYTYIIMSPYFLDKFVITRRSSYHFLHQHIAANQWPILMLAQISSRKCTSGTCRWLVISDIYLHYIDLCVPSGCRCDICTARVARFSSLIESYLSWPRQQLSRLAVWGKQLMHVKYFLSVYVKLSYYSYEITQAKDSVSSI